MGRVEKRDWRMAVTMNGGAKVVNAPEGEAGTAVKKKPHRSRKHWSTV